MIPFLDLTDHETGKRLMLRFDQLTALQEHAKDGTVVFVDGSPYWVREAIADVAQAIRSVASMQANVQQRQVMMMNGRK